jgi:hypothetical protein
MYRSTQYLIASLAAASLGLGLVACSKAHAFVDDDAGICRVADPTGTPLNIRTSPYGTIVATFNNGDPVTVLDANRDRRGNWWVYVGTPDLKPIGWVYRNFINCGPVAPSYYGS